MILFDRTKKIKQAKTVANRLLGTPPLSSIAENDKLVSGDLRLRCHASAPHSSRCSNCNTMSPDGKFAWLPDGTRMGDSMESLKGILKVNTYSSAWCIPCVLKLIKKAGGQEPVLEKAPPPPVPQPPTAEENERQKQYHQACVDREKRKHELAHALINRVLTADEIRETASYGKDLYTTYSFNGDGFGMSSQFYNEGELQQRLSTAWQIQTNLRMAEGSQPK